MKRYDSEGDDMICCDVGGDWVAYEDAEGLERENTRLKELNREMAEALQLIADHKGVAGFEEDGSISYMPVMPEEIQVIARKALSGNWSSCAWNKIGKVLAEAGGGE